MPRTPDYFKGKTAFITGAASGIGRATALLFGRDGANVVCTDRDLAGAERTAAEVERLGVRSLALETDVVSREQVDRAVKQSVDAFGRVDFQFNSAGSALNRATFLEIDDDLFDRTFDLNVKGTFYCMQAVLPHMLAQGSGVIVNVASMAHKRGSPGAYVHYAAAKAAVLTMTLGVAREFAAKRIRCLSVSPGPIDTGFQAAANTPPESIEKSLLDVPMKRFGRADEIGELVLFLCSDACEFMTADTVYVSGGGGWR
ncbi:SDR family oxidoreductase [Roseomonas terrae]|uniref:SDR family oxidoreductase n=1 Tax=Neoroseomonas terrae TaxID=424799 RepID=A0ABS5ELY9_9PROT|nr:SDR family NAD(P)-dependent oxidoreductase [Neoroseomonas terrae]MBR0652028.1 SDR family oxidoreductase [Neoroseomonas terrae]